MYFAYVPVNGELVKTKQNAALYGARYSFSDAANVDAMEKDLVSKLSELYGQPTNEESSDNWNGYKYKSIYWYGTNDTVLCLRTTRATVGNEKDNVVSIAYAWQKGDDLLKAANNLELARVEAESKAIEDLIESNSDNYDGL